MKIDTGFLIVTRFESEECSFKVEYVSSFDHSEPRKIVHLPESGIQFLNQIIDESGKITEYFKIVDSLNLQFI